MNNRSFFLVWAAMVLGGSRGVTQEPPSYARQVRPFLAKYCSECHNAKTFKAGLDLETYKAIKEGSDRGPILVPGKPDESLLVVLVEGKKDPRMPPKKAKRRPGKGEVKILRAWVAAGARDDSVSVKTVIPDIKPQVPTTAPVSALAYRPGSDLLAIGRYQEVMLVNSRTRKPAGNLAGIGGEVTALAFSPDGRYLVVASGKPGQGGDLVIYGVPPQDQPWPAPRHNPMAHKDVILDIAFSPDGKVLASAGYDTRVKLWDVATGKELRTLKDHSDSVYGLSFSPDGKLLATGAADRAVKVWQVETGKLLYTLGEATDWIYAVGWSPDGRHLAAGGVDKSIRVWETGFEKGKVVQSVFAHEGPVLRLVYAVDGKTLYSLGEDRIVKAWDTGRMVERKVYPRQTEAVLALAIRPDRQQLALGRYDGNLAFLNESSGKVEAEISPPEEKKTPRAKPEKVPAPKIIRITPSWGPRGRPIPVVIEGKGLDQIKGININYPGASGKIMAAKNNSTSLKAEITFPSNVPAGIYQLTLENPGGKSNPVSFTLDLFPAREEKEPNHSPGRGRLISTPTTIISSIAKAGDVHFYRFQGEKGRSLGVQIMTGVFGSKLDPFLQLIDPEGKVAARSSNGLLGYTFPTAGVYSLGVRDRELRGGPAMNYRLNLGPIPIVTSIFPLGLQRGQDGEIHLQGVFLHGKDRLRIQAPSNSPPGTKIPISFPTSLGLALGAPSVVVGEFPEVVVPPESPQKVEEIAVPGTANGVIGSPGSTGLWRFKAKKGQRLILEVQARRLGSALDSYIEILDQNTKPIPRASLRSVARTFVTFRDHDSSGAGIRIESWDELAVNDYLLVGNELLKIKDLPANPDADCIFFSERGQRIGFLDTTPTYHSLGTPMYKVEIHPPGTRFPPNGFPAITLNYRNDDGGPVLGRDSRLFFDPPADGEYRVRIGDSRGQGGTAYAYRLTVRPPRPNFNISFNPTAPAVFKGSSTPITVSVERLDGYQGEISVRLENLPAGFSAPATTIPAGENSTVFSLFAEPGAFAPSPKAPPLRLIARTQIDGQEIIKEAAGSLPRVMEPGDLVTTTLESEVTVKPGGQVRLTVQIERRNGFKGRVPLDVRGLPHGVRVLDIGLNGILITEKETKRTIVLYAEPWVRPTTHPFVVLSRREGKNSEHGAKSVLLRVADGGK